MALVCYNYLIAPQNSFTGASPTQREVPANPNVLPACCSDMTHGAGSEHRAGSLLGGVPASATALLCDLGHITRPCLSFWICQQQAATVALAQPFGWLCNLCLNIAITSF